MNSFLLDNDNPWIVSWRIKALKNAIEVRNSKKDNSYYQSLELSTTQRLNWKGDRYYVNFDDDQVVLEFLDKRMLEILVILSSRFEEFTEAEIIESSRRISWNFIDKNSAQLKYRHGKLV